MATKKCEKCLKKNEKIEDVCEELQEMCDALQGYYIVGEMPFDVEDAKNLHSDLKELVKLLREAKK